MTELMDTFWFNWLILPFFIFIARILDVSAGTLRIILMGRGKKNLAPLLGFVEILIWLIAIRQIFSNLNNVACYLAYAGGFAAGNFVGMWLDQKLAVGLQIVRIITRADASALIEELKKKGFGVTYVDGKGLHGPVQIIFLVIQRRLLNEVVMLIKRFNPKAFYSVEDVRLVGETFYNPEITAPMLGNMAWKFWSKKGK